jgi:hypothetical protein
MSSTKEENLEIVSQNKFKHIVIQVYSDLALGNWSDCSFLCGETLYEIPA